jgi:hypothetical protein
MEEEEERGLMDAAVEHFNAGRYFESHEVWEDLWHEEAPRERDGRAGIGFSPAGLGFDWRAIERALLAMDPPAEFGRVADILQFVRGRTPKNASPAG